MTLAARSLLFTTLLALTACSQGGPSHRGDGNVVNVYNWADYIGSDTIERFEAETGIRVNYDTYDSSEVVDVKMLAGRSGYDVVVHSNQFASRLVPIGVYQKIDKRRLTNYGNLDTDVVDKISVYDIVQDYGIPYHWGSTGFAWNVEMVRARLGDDFPMDSANVIFDPDVISKLADCGVSFLDSTTDMFPMVLAYLGRNPMATDVESSKLAAEQLRRVRPHVRYFSGTKMLSDLPNREVCVAMSWSGDYATAAARAAEAGLDIELRYTMPKEGSGLWTDSLYIPADAGNVDNAYRFIDFMLRADIAADTASLVNYANANGASWPLMDPAVRNDRAIFPDREDWDRMFPVVFGTPKEERFRTRAFAKLKAGL